MSLHHVLGASVVLCRKEVAEIAELFSFIEIYTSAYLDKSILSVFVPGVTW